jgi:hypothetical protein
VDGDADEWRMNQAEDMLMAASDAETLTNHNGIRQYMKAVVKFREALLVVAHIARGQPGRGPELLSICHTNTVSGRRRASERLRGGRVRRSGDAASQGLQGNSERTDHSSISASGGHYH